MRLTYNDRLNIERMLLKGYHKQIIADSIGCSLQTIYNEINRASYEHTVQDWLGHDHIERRYSPEIAEQIARENKKKHGRTAILAEDKALCERLRHYIVEKDYSPVAALYAIKSEGMQTVCPATVYAGIRKGYIEGVSMVDLPRRGKRPIRKKHRVAKTASRGTSIEKRPLEVLMRQTFGEWEMDLVVGPLGSSVALLVLTERLTRYEIIEPVKNHSAAEVVRALNRIEREMGASFYGVFHSITVDNGVEFSDHKGMEKALYRVGNRTKIYYCHGYAPHERGTNENQNLFIRRKYPKGTNFDKVKPTRRELAYLASWINDYPRRLFGGETAGQRFARELDALGFT